MFEQPLELKAAPRIYTRKRKANTVEYNSTPPAAKYI